MAASTDGSVDAPAPLVIDTIAPPPLISWHVFGFALIAAVVVIGGIAISVVAVVTIGSSSGLSGWIMRGLWLAVLIVAAFIARQSRRRRMLIENLASVAPGLISQMLEAELHRIRTQPNEVLTRATVQALRRAGHIRTIRITKPTQAVPIDPIVVDFEARLLRETDVGLRALEESQPGAGSEQRETPSSSADDHPLLRSMKRNFALSGGWFLLGWSAFQIARALPDAINSGRITFPLAVWSAIFLAIFALPRSAGLRASEWLAVPGGLLVRKPGRDGWTLHMFTPDVSLLIVMREMTGAWGVVVADSTQCNNTRMTDAEVHFLLRAWTSPLPPPPIERLSDLR